MKNTITKPKPPATRSVKVSDHIHHRLRVRAAQERMGLQDFIDNMLLSGLRRQLWKEFAPDEAKTE